MQTISTRHARLEKLAELVREADDHPEIRLPLLNEIKAALAASEMPRTTIEPSLEQFAHRVERWRYQILNHWSGRLPNVLAELASGLDCLTNELRGCGFEPKRQVREAILDARNVDLPQAVARCLDPLVPLETVEAETRERTIRPLRSCHRVPSERRPIVLYAPLYLSNHCINHCLYCGFRYTQNITRDLLDVDQALAEADVLGQRGIRHILLVAGEYPRLVSVDYLSEITAALVRRGFTISIEVAPQSTLGYKQLRDSGATGVTLYQETYNESRYAEHHPKGTKAWYDWRLEGLERAAEAGMRRLGLGILLGISEPEDDLRALIAHGRYLASRFPNSQLAFSLPRIHEAPDSFQPAYRVDDTTFIRFYCALRAAFPSAHLVLSTREAPELRDRLAATCITQMSAGSSTSPGGYKEGSDGRDRQQFPVFDHRRPDEMERWLTTRGFDVQWDFNSESRSAEIESVVRRSATEQGGSPS